jgi:transcriptional regulator with XRE-family HTH domain
MTFAERLKELRTKRGLSQSGLASASGRSLGVIRDYEQGKRKPTLESAVKLAKALGTTCEAFADCEDVAADADSPARKPAARVAAASSMKKTRSKK